MSYPENRSEFEESAEIAIRMLNTCHQYLKDETGLIYINEMCIIKDVERMLKHMLKYPNKPIDYGDAIFDS